MNWVRTGFRHLVAVAVFACVSMPSLGQTTLFNSNGFESPTFNTGSIVGQQGFISEPVGSTAATIQTGTVFAGNQALQISGPNLVNNTPFAGGNFWYRSTPVGSAYNPVAAGTPYVHASFQINTPSTLPLATDIPFAGIYLEGYDNITGSQRAITPVMVSLNGGITVFTTQAVGGSNLSVSTADGLVDRGQWTNITTELNFQAQTFRVYLDNSPTPVQFVLNGSGGSITPITDVPFRNGSNSTFPTGFFQTNRIAEIGALAFYGIDPFTQTPVQPLNNVYIDDFTVIATTTPVPEPGLILAATAAGFVGLRTWRRRRMA